MKTNTIYYFIISLTVLIMSVYLMWYVREGIIYKTGVVKEYYQKEKQNNNLDLSKTLKKEIENLAAEESVITRSFLEKNKIIDFITRIETTGKDFGLKTTIEDIKYGTAESVAKGYSLSPIVFNVQLEGSFTQIDEFILKILKSDSILNVSEFKLYKKELEGSSGYSARITITGTTISYE